MLCVGVTKNGAAEVSRVAALLEWLSGWLASSKRTAPESLNWQLIFVEHRFRKRHIRREADYVTS